MTKKTSARGKLVAEGVYKTKTKSGYTFKANFTYRINGDRKCETKSFRDQKSATAWRKKRSLEVELGIGLPQPKKQKTDQKTLSHYLMVLREKKATLSHPEWPLRALAEIESFFGPHYAVDDLSDLQIARYENHINQMKPKRERKSDEIALQTKKNYLIPFRELVKMIYRDLRKPYPEFSRIKGYSGKGAATPTKEQFEAWVRELKPRNKAAAFLMVVTAQRRTDAMTARWSDIKKVGETHIIRFRNSKTRKVDLKIPAPPELMMILSRMPRYQDVDFIFWNPKTQKPYCDFIQTFKRASKRAGLDIAITNHSLRKFATTEAVKSVKDIRIVAQLFGWSSPRLVEAVYSKADALADEVSAGMGEILREVL